MTLDAHDGLGPQFAANWSPGEYPAPHPDVPEGSFTVAATSRCPSTGEDIVLTWEGSVATRTEVMGGGLPLGHPMYRRPLINRNPALDFFSYRRGREVFTPP